MVESVLGPRTLKHPVGDAQGQVLPGHQSPRDPTARKEHQAGLSKVLHSAYKAQGVGHLQCTPGELRVQRPSGERRARSAQDCPGQPGKTLPSTGCCLCPFLDSAPGQSDQGPQIEGSRLHDLQDIPNFTSSQPHLPLMYGWSNTDRSQKLEIGDPLVSSGMPFLPS